MAKKQNNLPPQYSSLKLTRVSPISTFGVSVVFGLIMGLCVLVLTVGVWYSFDSLGVFDRLISTFAGEEGVGREKLEAWLSLDKFLVLGAIFGAMTAVFVPALSLFVATLYNMVARLTGGVRFVLSNQASLNLEEMGTKEEAPQERPLFRDEADSGDSSQ